MGTSAYSQGVNKLNSKQVKLGNGKGDKIDLNKGEMGQKEHGKGFVHY